jgi:choline-glycine betaine transporter
VYLKLHIERGIQAKIRPILVKIHKVLGAAIPVIGYVQIMLGVIASLGFCYDGTFRRIYYYIYIYIYNN